MCICVSIYLSIYMYVSIDMNIAAPAALSSGAADALSGAESTGRRLI